MRLPRAAGALEEAGRSRREGARACSTGVRTSPEHGDEALVHELSVQDPLSAAVGKLLYFPPFPAGEAVGESAVQRGSLFPGRISSLSSAPALR